MKKSVFLGILCVVCATVYILLPSSCIFGEDDPGIKGKNCLFVSTMPDSGDLADRPLINKLRSWKLNVVVVADTNLPSADDPNFMQFFEPFDFAFLSESPNSMSYVPFKSCPLPFLNLEPWACAKPALFWSHHPKSAANYPVVTSRVEANAPKELIGGLPPGEFQLVTGSSDTVNQMAVIGFIPTICHIPLLVLTPDSLVQGMIDSDLANDNALNRDRYLKALLDPSCNRELALSGSRGLMPAAVAVERGTLLSDDSTTTLNRAVTIGIHAVAYNYITEDAWTLIRSGINWILK